ncbi:ABL043Wp [Eremothecium gossypii ATCC 10895]|uniref:ABL043Wp n=1 Tax=Eremothecium gossypii (strain ATCC 10895 / CBS 109.51 / FGSC 9923 / NRRL Y-1056) TaxID=284811 RepID=Q75DR0_EREGS|nr:ABL043Wp [Eremothecium gossypii ATCC 10895]AAS50728.1 ABL043Wp [Eremothecium gossypii ATCC 10895]AEY95017.1 FABL043Wp [Eremothecium gossypii FDAG1]
MAAIQLEKTLVPLPSTRRNFGTHLSYDRHTNRIAYGSGKSAIVKSLDSDIVVQFTGHGSANVTVVRFSPVAGSQYVVSGDDAGRIMVWSYFEDEEKGQVETKLRSEFQVLAGAVADISWDFEGRRLCVVGAGRDRYGAFISWDTGNSLGEVTGHALNVNACHIRQARPMRAATVSDDGSMVFYKGPPFQFSCSDHTHHANGKFVRDVRFSPAKGAYLVSVGSDRKIVLYDGDSGEFIKYIGEDSEECGGFFSLAWVDDGDKSNRIVTASADGVVRLWDVEANRLLKRWELGTEVAQQQVGVVVTRDSNIISVSLDGTLNVFSIESDKPIKTIEGHKKGITALKTNPLVTASYDGRVLEWSAEGTAAVAAMHSNSVTSINNVGGRTCTVSWDGTLKVDNEEKHKFPDDPKASVAFEGMVALITNNKRLVLVKSESGLVVQETALSRSPCVVTMAKSHVAVGYEDSNIIDVFLVSDFATRFELALTIRGTPSALSFSPTEQYLAVGDVMGKILLFNVEQRTVVTSRWSFHTGKITSMDWRPDEDDENYIATAALDTHLFIYSVKKPMRVIKMLNAHKDGINMLGWEDPDHLITGGQDACIKRWRVSFS